MLLILLWHSFHVHDSGKCTVRPRATALVLLCFELGELGDQGMALPYWVTLMLKSFELFSNLFVMMITLLYTRAVRPWFLADCYKHSDIDI